ncbi:MAG TPA: hypothetical protein VFP68_24670 [Burkholderiaceae bacterium]|nr:hypothetical protein [Burkholderiaceae bacterium]
MSCLVTLSALAACDRGVHPAVPSTQTGTPAGTMQANTDAGAARGPASPAQVASGPDSGASAAAAATLPGGGLSQPMGSASAPWPPQTKP